MGNITTFFGAGVSATNDGVSLSKETVFLPKESSQHIISSISNKESRVTEEKSGLQPYFQSLSAPNTIPVTRPTSTYIDRKVPLDQCSTTTIIVEKRDAPLDRDEEYARHLQASFDRENAILSMVEQRHHKLTDRVVERHNSSKGRIDSFFSTSKKKV